ncbi:MAG TPA: hypothetical protein VND96_15920 [Candidatus Micrarchaeaceae archaeon]|nr:hypothetical protein [Candidatus Micrarchaeaceae archaeon]
MRDEHPELAGPCGPDPWYIEVAAEDDPVEVVGRLSRNLMASRCWFTRPHGVARAAPSY